MREVCFDTETTGLNPENGDRVIEIGCVEIIDRKITGNTYREIINPERLNSIESINITGLTDDILKDKPKFADISQGFIEFISDSRLIAHNANFDITFINYELSLLNIPPLANEIVDSLQIAKTKFPGKKNNLDALCERLEIDNSKREKHGALLDAELLAEVYLAMTKENNSQLFVAKEEDIGLIEVEKLLNIINDNEILTSRNYQVSEDELKKHMEFIDKNIKNSLWNLTLLHVVATVFK